MAPKNDQKKQKTKPKDQKPLPPASKPDPNPSGKGKTLPPTTTDARVENQSPPASATETKQASATIVKPPEQSESQSPTTEDDSKKNISLAELSKKAKNESDSTEISHDALQLFYEGSSEPPESNSTPEKQSPTKPQQSDDNRRQKCQPAEIASRLPERSVAKDKNIIADLQNTMEPPSQQPSDESRSSKRNNENLKESSRSSQADTDQSLSPKLPKPDTIRISLEEDTSEHQDVQSSPVKTPSPQTSPDGATRAKRQTTQQVQQEEAQISPQHPPPEIHATSPENPQQRSPILFDRLTSHSKERRGSFCSPKSTNNSTPTTSPQQISGSPTRPHEFVKPVQPSPKALKRSKKQSPTTTPSDSPKRQRNVYNIQTQPKNTSTFPSGSEPSHLSNSGLSTGLQTHPQNNPPRSTPATEPFNQASILQPTSGASRALRIFQPEDSVHFAHRGYQVLKASQKRTPSREYSVQFSQAAHRFSQAPELTTRETPSIVYSVPPLPLAAQFLEEGQLTTTGTLSKGYVVPPQDVAEYAGLKTTRNSVPELPIKHHQQVSGYFNQQDASQNSETIEPVPGASLPLEQTSDSISATRCPLPKSPISAQQVEDFFRQHEVEQDSNRNPNSIPSVCYALVKPSRVLSKRSKQQQRTISASMSTERTAFPKSKVATPITDIRNLPGPPPSQRAKSPVEIIPKAPSEIEQAARTRRISVLGDCQNIFEENDEILMEEPHDDQSVSTTTEEAQGKEQ